MPQVEAVECTDTDHASVGEQLPALDASEQPAHQLSFRPDRGRRFNGVTLKYSRHGPRSMPAQVARAEAHRQHRQRIGRTTATDQHRQGTDPLPHAHRREARQPVQQRTQPADHGQAGQQQAQQIAAPARAALVDIGLAQPVPEQAQVQVTGQRAGNAQRQVQARLLADGRHHALRLQFVRHHHLVQHGQQGEVEHHVGHQRGDTGAHRGLGVLPRVERRQHHLQQGERRQAEAQAVHRHRGHAGSEGTERAVRDEGRDQRLGQQQQAEQEPGNGNGDHRALPQRSWRDSTLAPRAWLGRGSRISHSLPRNRPAESCRPAMRRPCRRPPARGRSPPRLPAPGAHAGAGPSRRTCQGRHRRARGTAPAARPGSCRPCRRPVR
ncbi:hypothetical protein G6F50_013331 [Rhizopus delemar]|uniref:Uncharacterized protein n=1 Tax=Rhizopus delemar TaxID=936053 RepID=A0A9P6YIW3_9FUNG|nr:hypothetical protein G6F50_013331 [Rhizopus delemar]